MKWYDVVLGILFFASIIYTGYSIVVALPNAMAECEAKGLELAKCDSHCGCVHYGCVNETEQYENEHMGCALV